MGNNLLLQIPIRNLHTTKNNHRSPTEKTTRKSINGTKATILQIHQPTKRIKSKRQNLSWTMESIFWTVAEEPGKQTNTNRQT